MNQPWNKWYSYKTWQVTQMIWECKLHFHVWLKFTLKGYSKHNNVNIYLVSQITKKSPKEVFLTPALSTDSLDKGIRSTLPKFTDDLYVVRGHEQAEWQNPSKNNLDEQKIGTFNVWDSVCMGRFLLWESDAQVQDCGTSWLRSTYSRKSLGGYQVA